MLTNSPFRKGGYLLIVGRSCICRLQTWATTSLSEPSAGDDNEGSPTGELTPVRWGLGDALLGLALTIVVPAIVGAIALGAVGVEEGRQLALWAVALLQIPLWVGLLGAPLWATYKKGRSSLISDFGLSMQWIDIPIGLATGLGAQFFIGLVLQWFYKALGVDADKVGQTAKDLTEQATDPVGVVLLLIVVVLAAPVLEELFYRGLWLKSLERKWGTGWAVGLSAVLFGAIHFQPYDFPALATVGLLASLLTVRFGRLGPAIWMHVAFNLTAVSILL